MALAARCCYIFAMSWTSTTQAKLGMGAFSREWIRPVPVPPILPPPTTSPPLAVSAPAHDDNRARYRVMTFMTFFGKRGYPQARIDHGKAGDDHLTRYYKKHGTYSGATVYIKSAADTNPVASAQSSASTPGGRHQPGCISPVVCRRRRLAQRRRPFGRARRRRPFERPWRQT